MKQYCMVTKVKLYKVFIKVKKKDDFSFTVWRFSEEQEIKQQLVGHILYVTN